MLLSRLDTLDSASLALLPSLPRPLTKVQATVERYMADWATKGTVSGYTETLTLVFDVLINQVGMQLEIIS